MKIGEVLTTKIFKSQGFGRGTGATFKCKDGHVMAYLYMGTITQDTAPHWNADGVIAAMGYGPIMSSVVQRGLIDALQAAKDFEQHPGGSHLPAGGWLKLHEQIDAALLAAENIRAAGAPVIDPILKDAARFGALLNLLETRIGADATLWALLDQPKFECDDTDPRARILAIIDAATQK